MAFGFRLRFFAYGPRFETDASRLDFTLCDGVTVRLSATRGAGAPLHETEERDFQICGSGFPTDEAARACGERLRRAIQKSSVELGMGFDVGRDIPTSSWSDAVKKAVFDKQGVRVLDNVHGLVVFDEDPPVDFVTITARGHTSTDPGTVLHEWQRQYEAAARLAPHEALAFELYSAAAREPFVRARFLTLVSSVEVLARPASRDAALTDLVDTFRDDVAAAAAAAGSSGDPAWQSFIGSIAELRRESIRSACKRLIQSSLGKDQWKAFDRLYEIRSAMTHQGDAPPGVDLLAAVDELHAIVRQLLRPLGGGA